MVNHVRRDYERWQIFKEIREDRAGILHYEYTKTDFGTFDVVYRYCKACEKKFYPKWHSTRQVFCSKACRDFAVNSNRFKIKCEHCGKIFLSRKFAKFPKTKFFLLNKYCSKHCKEHEKQMRARRRLYGFTENDRMISPHTPSVLKNGGSVPDKARIVSV